MARRNGTLVGSGPHRSFIPSAADDVFLASEEGVSGAPGEDILSQPDAMGMLPPREESALWNTQGERSMQYQLRPGTPQANTRDTLVAAGVEPIRAEKIARGLAAMTTAERDAVVGNAGNRMQQERDAITARRNALNGVPPAVEPAAGPRQRRRRRNGVQQPTGVAPQSRTDGAPANDIEGLTPQAYMDNIQTRIRQLQDGGASNPLPGSPGFDTEGALLSYRPGMDDAEYDAAEANRLHRERMLRGMTGTGDFRDQVHSQQVMDVGTADDIQKWNDYVASSPETKRRYDPAGYEADVAAASNQAAMDHAKGLAQKYGQPVADAYMEANRSGKPMDMAMVRTSAEQKRVGDRQRLEMMAREEGPSGPARDELRAQDARSGYRGAMGGSEVSGDWAAGSGPDGEVEHKAQRFARKTADRAAEEKRRRDLIAARAQLGGFASPGQVAAMQMLEGDARQRVLEDALTPKQMQFKGNAETGEFGWSIGGDGGSNGGDMERLTAQLTAQATQAQLDRDATAAEAEAERQYRREVEEANRLEREEDRKVAREESQARRDEMMQKIETERLALQAQITQLQDQSRYNQARLDQEANQFAQSNPSALAAENAAREADIRRQAMEDATRIQRQEAAVSQYGPGILDITDASSPSFDTPEAQASLRSIAAAADQSWAGFYESDAKRMDGILKRLGLADDVRRQLVENYGLGLRPTRLAAEKPGGRGSLTSGIYNYFSPPAY